MRIGIPRESRPGETLVAATSITAAQLEAPGLDPAPTFVSSARGQAAPRRLRRPGRGRDVHRGHVTVPGRSGGRPRRRGR